MSIIVKYLKINFVFSVFSYAVNKYSIIEL